MCRSRHDASLNKPTIENNNKASATCRNVQHSINRQQRFSPLACRAAAARESPATTCAISATAFRRASGHDTEDTEPLEEEEEEGEEYEEGACWSAYEMEEIHECNTYIQSWEEVQERRMARMARHTKRSDTGVPRYVVKRLRAHVRPNLRDDAICDLTSEAMFLGQLTHPNILRLRGTVGVPGTPSFMLVMDRLTSNLNGRMHQWRQAIASQCHHHDAKWWSLGLARGRNSRRDALQAFHVERLMAAFDIARALQHLHQHSILYRDIKVSTFFLYLTVREHKVLLT